MKRGGEDTGRERCRSEGEGGEGEEGEKRSERGAERRWGGNAVEGGREGRERRERERSREEMSRRATDR